MNRLVQLIAASVLAMLVLAPAPARGAQAAQVSQYGITWTFDGQYEVGQFANGDYWVVGPVIITDITLAFDGSHNGWQVNPTPGDNQGYDTRINGFDATRVPGLPHAAQAGESIIQSVSLQPLSDTSCRPCLDTAAVLTVLSAIPPNSGSTAGEDTFGENNGVAFSAKAGVALYAQIDCSESQYWKKLADNSASGSKTCADPYGCIDGGEVPGYSYLDCCLAKP